MLALVLAYLVGGVTFVPLVCTLLYAFNRWQRAQATRAAAAAFPMEGINEDEIDPSFVDATAEGWIQVSHSLKWLAEKGPVDPDDEMDEPVVDADVADDGAQFESPPSPSNTAGLNAHVAEARYWAVIGEGRMRLYADELRGKLLHSFNLKKYLAVLWPLDAREYQLFYRKYPICFIQREREESVPEMRAGAALALPGALYFYARNSSEKEDIYFALLEGMRRSPDIALPYERDPHYAAKLLLPTMEDNLALQSTVWDHDAPVKTRWINGLLGRIFLSIKDTAKVQTYLQHKFSYKLSRAASSASAFVGEVTVSDVSCGSSVPFFTEIHLRQLATDGNLVIDGDMIYNGGFSLKISALLRIGISSVKTVEIPVKLSLVLKSLRGRIVLRIKPPPSTRIWYSFDEMPTVDLQIDPVVGDTQLSYSFVQNYIKAKVMETLRETMVLPNMDDISFYDTAEEFYRGGIWDHRGMPSGGSFPKSREHTLQVPCREKQKGGCQSRSRQNSDLSVGSWSSAFGSDASRQSTMKRFSAWAQRRKKTVHTLVSDAMASRLTKAKCEDTYAATVSMESTEYTFTSASAVEVVESAPVQREQTADTASPGHDSSNVAQREFGRASGSRPARHAVRRKPVAGSVDALDAPAAIDQCEEYLQISLPEESVTTVGRPRVHQTRGVSEPSTPPARSKFGTPEPLTRTKTNTVVLKPGVSTSAGASLATTEVVANRSGDSDQLPGQHRSVNSLSLQRLVHASPPSQHQRHRSSSEASSVRSRSSQPELPPRRRRHTVLQNVAPEPATSVEPERGAVETELRHLSGCSGPGGPEPGSPSQTAERS